MNHQAHRAGALIGLLALCLGVCVLAGCYTTLRHPMTADLSNDYSYQEKSCYDCHDEAAFYHSNYGVYFDYYYDSPWFGYYSDPWWYGTYWQGGRGGGHGGTDYRDSDERHHWGRGVPSGSPRGGGSSSAAPYLRDDYKPAPAKGSQPKPAEKPSETKGSKEERTKGQRGKKK